MSDKAMTVKQRSALFEDMADVTKTVATEGFEKMQKGYKADLLVRHALGELINKIFNSKDLDEAAAKEEVNKLAQYWGQSYLSLYDLRNVALAFTREFLAEEVQKSMSNGNYLTWTHFKELQKVKESKRIAVLNKVRQNSWSANELALELRGSGSVQNSKSGGRNPTVPKTPIGMLQKIFATVQHADNYLTVIQEPFNAMQTNVDEESIDLRFIENLETTLSKLDSTIENCQKTMTSLLSLKDKADKVIEARTASETGTLIAAKNKKEDEVENEVSKPKRGRPPKAKHEEPQDEF